MYKESRWAVEILDSQNDDGAWGYFHTLSEPKRYPLTTEQALRRLAILGYTIDDEPIQKAVRYMGDCLAGKRQIPDRPEKVHDWNIFTTLMLSTWIRRFTNDNDQANETAQKWATVISSAFPGSIYNHSEYEKAYHDVLGMKPKGGRLIDFKNFYPVSLTADMYDEKTERAIFDCILNHEHGIYYIYDETLSVLPASFTSKQASRYLGAIELLTAYKHNRDRFLFVHDWLMGNRNENGKWDMSSSVNDKIYFPLSDSWRHAETRTMDCTYRIQNLLDAINIDNSKE